MTHTHERDPDDPWSGEPTITINDVLLTTAQSILVRVALGSFALSLSHGLSNDEHGKSMTLAYQRLLKEVVELMSAKRT